MRRILAHPDPLTTRIGEAHDHAGSCDPITHAIPVRCFRASVAVPGPAPGRRADRRRLPVRSAVVFTAARLDRVRRGATRTPSSMGSILRKPWPNVASCASCCGNPARWSKKLGDPRRDGSAPRLSTRRDGATWVAADYEDWSATIFCAGRQRCRTQARSPNRVR